MLIAIPLTLLTLGTDYWVAEAPNSDTAEVTCAGTAFQTGDSDGILTFTDGSNLKLNGNFVTTADDTITLVYDGTNWYEMCRSVN